MKAMLEWLPNELFFSIFQRLSTAHLFKAFEGLNSRFDALLFVYFQSFGQIDFRSISKKNFNILCEDYLPLFIDKIKTISISDEDECPQSIDLFFSYGFRFSQFINLQNFSIFHIYNHDKLNQIIRQCSHLPHLKNINIIDSHFHYDFNDIWSLSNLINCNVKTNTHQSNCHFSLTKMSTSIEHLSITNKTFGLGEMISLLEYTPNLRYLEIDVHHYFLYHEFTNVISSIIILKMSIRSSFDVLIRILENMPNLIDFKIEIKNLYINGHQWEQIINNYLTKLKLFQLKMNFQLSENEDKTGQIGTILDTFRTHFWLDQRHWFIQLNNSPYDAIIYTLPYAFDQFSISHSTISKSTYPTDGKQWSYGQVHHLNCLSVTESLPLNPIQFPNVRHLDIDYYFYNYVSFISPILDRVTSIVIKLQNDSFRNPLLELEKIINHASYLYSLTFLNFPDKYQLPLNVTHSTIRRLDFKQCHRHFTRSECIALSHSLMGSQCEVLLINILDQTDVIEFVNIMINLRMLYVQCLHHIHSKTEQLSFSEGHHLHWLKQQLPSICTINTNLCDKNSIQLWLQ